MLSGLTSHEHRASDIRGEDRIEAFAVRINETLEYSESGVVNQDVQAAEFLEDVSKRPHHVGFVGNVGTDRMNLQRTRRFGKLLLITSGDRNLRAGVDQCRGNCAADSSAPTADQCSRVAQVHTTSSISLCV